MCCCMGFVVLALLGNPSSSGCLYGHTQWCSGNSVMLRVKLRLGTCQAFMRTFYKLLFILFSPIYTLSFVGECSDTFVVILYIFWCTNWSFATQLHEDTCCSGNLGLCPGKMRGGYVMILMKS